MPKPVCCAMPTPAAPYLGRGGDGEDQQRLGPHGPRVVPDRPGPVCREDRIGDCRRTRTRAVRFAVGVVRPSR
jgi:hypothetical protein